MLFVMKTCGFVRAIAKGFVRGVPTTAKGDRVAAGEAIYLALHVDDFEFPFDAQWAIVSNDDLGRSHSSSILAGSTFRSDRNVQRKYRACVRNNYFLILRHGRIDFIRPCPYA